MSLNLTFGSTADDDTARAWLAELNATLATHGQPAHREPSVPLQAWSFKRRVQPLLDAAEATAGAWAVLEGVTWSDAVFVPRPLPTVLRAPDGLTVASLPALLAELTRLAAALAAQHPDPDHPQREATAQLSAAAAGAAAAGCALWAR
ncbi:MAG: hypothetical protein H6702_16140 [Myxococcales bacterium]|nr:hypothetical protein [Myxococcales bacterium]